MPKTIGLIAIHHFMMKILKKKELQQIESNHLSDTEVKDFMKQYHITLKKHFHF